MSTSRRATRGRRSRSVIFGAVFGAALGLTQIAGASDGSSGSLSADGTAAPAEECAQLSATPLCRNDAASTPERSGDATGAAGNGEAATATDAAGAGGPATEGEEEPSPADLQVTKTSDAEGTLDEGDPITYTITVTNVGGTEAEDVEVHDLLPPGMGGLSPLASLEGDLCTVASSVVVGGISQATVDCGPVSLGSGESASVEIDADTSGLCGTFVNRVDVKASNEPADLVGPENHAQATDEVEECHPSLSLDVTASPTQGPVGTEIVLTYTVTNTGDTRLYGVTVDDELGTLSFFDGFSLAAGRTERFTATATLGTSPITSVATAVGEDVTGHQVSAQDSATVTVVSAGGEGDGDGNGQGGTPFTGADTGGLWALVLVLSTLGGTLVALTGRRRGAAD